MNTYIKLPYSHSNPDKQTGFWSNELLDHLENTPEKGVPIGGRLCTLNKHDIKVGLDFWLRTNYSKHPDVRQTCIEVKEQLIESGDFEIKKIKTKTKGKRPEWVFRKSTTNKSKSMTKNDFKDSIFTLSRHRFTDNQHINLFINTLSEHILGKEFHHQYDVSMKAWKKSIATQHGKEKSGEKEVWSCSSLNDAFDQYWWHGDYNKNESQLSELANEIREIQKPGYSEQQLFISCIKILDWGQVYRGSIAWLINALESGSLKRLILQGKALIESDAPDITPFCDSGELRMDSGITKIYSLICDNSIIYDDRVASAMTLIAGRTFFNNTNLSLEEKSHLSKEIKNTESLGHGDSKKQKNKFNNPSYFSSQVKVENHAQLNIYANWIIDEAINRSLKENTPKINRDWKVNINTDQASPDEISHLRRKIEAALFMIGSDISYG